MKYGCGYLPFFCFYLLLLLLLISETGRQGGEIQGERETYHRCERNIEQAVASDWRLEMKPTTWACGLIRNWTHYLLVYGMVLHSTEPYQPGPLFWFYSIPPLPPVFPPVHERLRHIIKSRSPVYTKESSGKLLTTICGRDLEIGG